MGWVCGIGTRHFAGEGSKTTDPNKTGQYGVGFNCVYHLTDAPSFLTCGPRIGESLCVFDPHARYVPGASVEEPGRRYDDVPELKVRSHLTWTLFCPSYSNTPKLSWNFQDE